MSRSSVDGKPGNGDSGGFVRKGAPEVSATGGFVTFSSYASDLVPEDFNGPFVADVFLYVPE